MAYTTNPRIEEVRYKAYCLVHYRGWSTRQVARHLGYAQSTIVKWSKRKPSYNSQRQLVIPTQSSRPYSHPRQLPDKVVCRILEIRAERQQCAEIIHHRLKEEGISVSLSSIKRVLKRNHCSRYSKWKKWHKYPQRPAPDKPGVLVQLDTVMEGRSANRLCAYALIDVHSRWAFASPIVSPNSRLSVKFVRQTQKVSPFPVQTLQTDHGSEFSKWFTKVIESHGVKHRHSRVRRPTDNGYIERFIRTFQDECLHRLPRDLRRWEREIPKWLDYYNKKRPHMGLNFQTPMEVITSY